MKPDVLVCGRLMPHVMAGLEERYTLHKPYEADDPQAFLREVGGRDPRRSPPAPSSARPPA